ncbi:Germinal-center associated nuclear protein [Bulinus truncatus]|nr:Germinal-center associated nuclear protein [Bulinus truncatus]
MQPFVSSIFNSNSSISHQPESRIGSQSPQAVSIFGGTQSSSIFGNQPSSIFSGGTSVRSLFGGVNSESMFSSSNTGTSNTMPQASIGDAQTGSVFGGTSSGSHFGRVSSESSHSGSVFSNSSQSLSFGQTQPSSSFGTVQSGISFCPTQPSSSFGTVQFGATSGNSQSGLTFGSTQGTSSFGSTQGASMFGSTQGASEFGSTQGTSVFGSRQGLSVFGSSQGASAFGNAPSGSIFGGSQTDTSLGNSQPVSSFGSSHSVASFGNNQSGLSFGVTQPSNSFGTTQSGTSSATQPGTFLGTIQPTKSFGAAQSGTPFGAAQSGTPFGSAQSGTPFGAAQSGTPFGAAQSGTPFGAAQSGTPFGAAQSGTPFGAAQSGTPFGAAQSGKSFGNSQPSSSFGNTQSGPLFGTSQPGSSFGTTQSGPSFGTTQPSSFFGTIQSGPSFGTSQPGSIIGTTQSGPSFGTSQQSSSLGTTQSGKAFSTSQQGSLFATPQSGTTFTSSQPNSFENSVKSQSTSIFGSTTCKFDTSDNGTVSNFTDKGNIFDNAHSETSADKTKLFGVFSGAQSSSSTLGPHGGFTFNNAPISSFDQSKSVFGGTQSVSKSDRVLKSSSEGHNTVSIFGSRDVNSGQSVKSAQFSHVNQSVDNLSNETLAGGSQASSVYLGKGMQQPSIFGGKKVSTESYNTQMVSSGTNSIFSTSFSKSDGSSEPNIIKRPGQIAQGSSSLFGKSSAPAILPFKNESQMLQNEVVSTTIKPCDKTLVAAKSSESEGQPKNVTLFGKNENQIKTQVKKRSLMSAFQSSHYEDLEGKKLFGDSLSSSHLSGKDPPQLQESRLNRTASSYDLWQHGTENNNHTRQEPSLNEEKITQKESSSLKKGKVSVWSRNTLDRRKRPSIIEEERRENKRSCTTNEHTRARLSSLRKSVEDVSSKTSLIVKEIPAQFNKGATLRTHFSQFGNIIKLIPVVNKRTAYITFETHEQAEHAKREGKHLAENGPSLSIFWRTNPVLKSPESKSKEGVPNAAKKLAFSRSAVEDELSSMAESCDFQGELSGQSSGVHLKPRGSRRRSQTPPPTSVLSQPSSLVPDKDTVRELWKKIHHAKAKDSAGRIELLDARDKLLRILRGRQQSDLASAKAFSGTCPDMCPEKERYYREDIRRLALYEVLPNTLTSITGQKSKVDHSRAVKEYSRSSADQEEPLPHELRPLPVLVLTMNYLLSQVADQGRDGQWSEWYDFLWNRTRGIRKKHLILIAFFHSWFDII